ncbi:MAG: ABC transporter ATP-binding protein [Acidilobaceae archaeon]|nr:ABC transporter ATP-binding protein [Acidilobaceae archaeon]MCX8165929.1 ABC transporter ATP-binding protein [Acidilobaceae archaeon]MDW7974572.1 ABC transporter ATP-binding protein [Sulfolobales archaeon]
MPQVPLHAVEARGVAKKIGKREVLRGFSISVERGSVHVLAGPNGAGKTTAIRIIMGLVRRDAGELRVLGADPESEEWGEVKLRIGYLPEEAQPYERLTGEEHVRLFASLYGRDEEEAIRRAAEISGLGEAMRARTATYSKGMKRRLMLALSLMHDPELAILDEPTGGLDVVSSYRIREVIRLMSSRGTTFLITTHDLQEAQQMANRVTFISKGLTVAEGKVEEVLRAYGARTLEEAYVRAVGFEE